jgi:hypothetical protein
MGAYHHLKAAQELNPQHVKPVARWGSSPPLPPLDSENGAGGVAASARSWLNRG